MSLTIKLKTLDSKTFEYIVNSNDTLESRIENIKDLFSITNNIRLIHAGKVLSDLTKTFEEHMIQNTDVIVVMEVKPKKIVNNTMNTTANPIPAPAPMSAPVPVPAPMSAPMSAPVPAHAPQNSLTESWTSAPLNDSASLYSIEQIHAIMPIFIQMVLENPTFALNVLTNPNGIGALIAGQSFRPIIRQLMAQSTQVVNAIRSGNASVSIGFNLSTTSALPSLNTPLYQTNTNASIVINVPNDEDDDVDNVDDTNLGNVITEEDNDIIQNLMSLFNVSNEIATATYLQSGKNADFAATLLMDLM